MWDARGVREWGFARIVAYMGNRFFLSRLVCERRQDPLAETTGILMVQKERTSRQRKAAAKPAPSGRRQLREAKAAKAAKQKRGQPKAAPKERGSEERRRERFFGFIFLA